MPRDRDAVLNPLPLETCSQEHDGASTQYVRRQALTAVKVCGEGADGDVFTVEASSPRKELL